jgi:hypothetical protein
MELNESISPLYKPPIDKCDWLGCDYRPSRPRDLSKHKDVNNVNVQRKQFISRITNLNAIGLTVIKCLPQNKV